MAARRLEAAASANEKQAFAALFFFFTRSELGDRSTYQSVTLAKSFLSWTKLGFEIWSRKWKQKDKFALNNAEQWWKIHGIQNWLVELHGSILSCLGPAIVQDSRSFEFSGAVAYISLHSTMYTTIIDRQDTCWARFVWKDARPPLFFPTTKWRKKSLNSVTVHL